VRTRVVVALVTAVAASITGGGMASAGVLITPTRILGGPEYVFYPSSNGTYLGWTQNSSEHPKKWNAYVSTDPGVDQTKLNQSGTGGWFGEIDTDSNEAVYQQTEGASSDIYLVGDVSDPSSRSPVSDINTGKWEWQPRLSDDHILFTRVYLRQEMERLFLYDRSATDSTLLREWRLSNRPYLLAGSLGSRYATWTFCRRICDAFIYDIAQTTTTKIPNPNDRDQYAPSVEEVHGMAYWVRSGHACGLNVGIWRAPIGDLTDTANVADFPDGIDTDYMTSPAFDTTNSRVDLIFSRVRCQTGNTDIYELQGVDTLT
jgi:hypothetical protein